MKRLLALAAACVLTLTGCAPAADKSGGSADGSAGGESPSDGVRILTLARYPEMAAYPSESAYTKADGSFDDAGFSKAFDAWRADRETRQAEPAEDGGAVNAFTAAVMAELLAGGGTENRVCSPLNLYMALSMLAEITDGASRAQLLDLLGAADMDALRARADALWNANYCQDGAVTSVLADSLWLNQEVSFVQETADVLSDVYHASVYQGEMGSEAFNQALRTWISEQTGGLLDTQAGGLSMDPNTLLALASTVYFQAKWSQEFSESETAQDVFHANSGDVTCDFLRQSTARHYYRANGFSAVAQTLEGSGAMWFLLPEEGEGAERLLTNPQTMALLADPENWTDADYLTVNLAAPKFDVVSDVDLTASLRALGITDVFDAKAADFSPITAEEAVLSQARHAARVVIDEKGCTAAAYTVMMACGTAMPPQEEVDFVLNRPFLFAITGESGQVLFAGVVNTPV